jgi:hypothetical protein
MNAIQEAMKRLLRGPQASRFLGSLGIDARRYWLLMDLFDQLSERGEMLDQLGRNGVALWRVAWAYAGISILFAIFLVIARLALATYFFVFLTLTAFFLLVILLSETGNSLVNPAEGLVLAHQPINGATYMAAKLTHLARIVLYLAVGLNVVPALAGLMLKESGWSYPFLHLLAALAVGFIAALLCCALYGWLIRLVPARRLKTAGQLAGMIPFLVAVLGRTTVDLLAHFHVFQWLPAQAAPRWALGLTVGFAAAVIVTLGIRSLSADYLIRVSSILHGPSSDRVGARKSWIGEIVAQLFGGQPARAGCVFVSRMMRRDFQFRRQMAYNALPGLVLLMPLLASGWRTDPLSGRFTVIHLIPHVFGFVLFFVCSFLPYGNDFKGAWAFLLAPAEAFGRFAQGVYAALWLQMIAIPHVVMLLLFAWPWGIWHAGLFVAYSLVISSVYLAAELRLIDGMPFSRSVDPTVVADLSPLMIFGGVTIAIAIGVQYFLVFRAPAIVAAVTVGAGVTAYLLGRGSVVALADSIRYSLGLLSVESGTLYKEINI